MAFWRRKETRASVGHPKDTALVEIFGGRAVSSGQTVTPDTALNFAAVYAAVRILAETVASLPLIVYRRLQGGGKERAIDHPLYGILHNLPNPEITAFELIETMMGHLCLWGNAYAQIQRDGFGRIIGLWPLRPNQINILRMPNGNLLYEYSRPAGLEKYNAADIFHVKALSAEGLIGKSPIRQAREAIGLAMATEEYGSRFFSNDSRPGGVLQHPNRLSDQAHKRLLETWEHRHQGTANTRKVAILEEGMTWQTIGIPPDDAQFLQTRKFQLQEIARIYRIPPHMLGDLERATFSNVEQQAIDFVVHTIRPWLVRWEKAISRCLFTEEERQNYFAEFLVDGLLRGDIESRYRAYATGRQWGWLTTNMILERENMNPVPDGDDRLIPINMMRIRGGDGERRRLEYRSVRARENLREAYRHLWEDVASRIIRREKTDVLRAISKFLPHDKTGFFSWLNEFYEAHRSYIRRQIAPVVNSYMRVVYGEAALEAGTEPLWSPELEKFARDYSETFALRHTLSSVGQLRDLVDQGLEAVEARLAEWEERRPTKIATREIVQAENAIAKITFDEAGHRVQWRTSEREKTCPYCSALDGRVIAKNETFLSKGDSFAPNGADPLVVRNNISHAPCHEGCDCTVVPA